MVSYKNYIRYTISDSFGCFAHLQSQEYSLQQRSAVGTRTGRFPLLHDFKIGALHCFCLHEMTSSATQVHVEHALDGSENVSPIK